DPIAYWAAYKRWPRQYCEQGGHMEKHMLARKRSVSGRSKNASDVGSATRSSSDQGGSKRSEYSSQRYEELLETKGVFMKLPSSTKANEKSRELCKILRETAQEYPRDTGFRDDLFEATCSGIYNRNEARIIRDIGDLIVPSAENLAKRGAGHLERLVESVNQTWDCSIAITTTRPKPDFSVGFREKAFTQEQYNKMKPFLGDRDEPSSYFKATSYMYFPFLTSEVKAGNAPLDVADRQNAHSAAIAVRAVVELFRLVGREEELHREILAWSVSHHDRSVRIHGYFADIGGPEPTYHRHMIRDFGIMDQDGKEKWTAYQFTKNVYDNWMPEHFARISSAIDQIPAHVSFSVSNSDLRFPEQSES
ncbi:uncharacterized protein MYCFIDRAFT_98289, partial [Pseudocercospora fijiensis CIRAD86]